MFRRKSSSEKEAKGLFLDTVLLSGCALAFLFATLIEVAQMSIYLATNTDFDHAYWPIIISLLFFDVVIIMMLRRTRRITVTLLRNAIEAEEARAQETSMTP